MQFSITILGCSSAIPTKDRFPTAQVVTYGNEHYLLDCAEGTQIQLRKYRFSFQRISKIFISHMHADHFLGLPGLLSTMDLLGRTSSLQIYAPIEVIRFIESFKQLVYANFQYPIEYHIIEDTFEGVIWENEQLEVIAFPVKHAVPCHAFLFKEKLQSRRMKKNAITDYFLSIEQIKLAKEGKDIEIENGKIIPNSSLTHSAPHPRSYAFVTDTAFYPEITNLIKGVDLLYHEATFESSFESRANQTFHSTAAQAAKIASLAEVKKLLIGHYSVRYEDLNILLQEAESVFNPTELALEGKKIVLEYDSRTENT
ncbi:MAG: ribonuclease Z [Flavobacteriales bacterium]|nr:ribonuclease Z [Flavobacteriales bacterium]